MSKRIIITGATGLIGFHISQKLIDRGDEVIIFTRSPERASKKIRNAYDYVKWNYDSADDWHKYLNGVDSVIHLAGENVMAQRWNEEHKKRVLESRVKGTQNLVDAIGATDDKPESFICASAIGIYDNDIKMEYDEDGKHGSDFLAHVTERWEEEAQKVEKYNVRRVSIRTGIVLDRNDGALAKMLTPFKLFVGGPIGSGKQWMPWIHIDDIAELFIYAVDNKNVKSAINGTAPYPVTMTEFADTLGRILSRPSVFKVPNFALKFVLGEGAESVLKGSKIIPRKTIDAGYGFRFTNLEKALRDIL